MSAPGESVLERNLRLLLTRARVPVVARASFRLQLERDFLARCAARYGSAVGREAARFPRTAGTWARLAAAALILFGLGLALRGPWSPGAPAPTLEGLLASGRPALREADGPWRALEVRTGPDGGAIARAAADSNGALELVTPADVGVELELARGHLRVEPDSRFLLARPDRARLERGSLEARVGAGASLEIATGEGTVELAAAAAALAYAAPERLADGARDDGHWVRVDVLSVDDRGLVETVDGAVRRELAVGARVFLRAGRTLTGTLVAEGERETGASRRAALTAPDGPPPVVAEEADGGDGPVALRGLVRGPGGFGAEDPIPVSSFLVVLLEQRRLPDAASPMVFYFEDPDGRFELPPQSPGTYTLFVRAEGLAVWKRRDLRLGAAPADPAAVPELEVQLDQGVTVRGVVLDARDDQPVPGAVVVSESDAMTGVLPVDSETLTEFGIVRFATTDANGGFELEHVASGRQVLRASGGGLSVAWLPAFELRGPAPLDGLELRLPPGGTIAGFVLDDAGEPVPGQSVVGSCTDFTAARPCLSYRDAVSDEQGAFRIEGLPAGMIAVLRMGPEGSPETDVESDMVLATVRPGEVSEVEFLVSEAAGGLRGNLFDDAGRPLGARSVWALPSSGAGASEAARWQSTTTRADGSFAFAGLEPDTYDLFVSGRVPPDMTRLATHELVVGQETVVALRAPDSAISGRVTDGATGRAARGAIAILFAPDLGRMAGKAVVDGEGRYRFEHVAAGRYDVLVIPNGGPLALGIAEAVTVVEGLDVDDQDFQLGPGGSLLVEVFAAGTDGSDPADAGPVAGARVEFFDARGRSYLFRETQLTDADGRHTVGGLNVGTWRVRVTHPGFQDAERNFEVGVGERGRLRFSLRPIGGR